MLTLTIHSFAKGIAASLASNLSKCSGRHLSTLSFSFLLRGVISTPDLVLQLSSSDTLNDIPCLLMIFTAVITCSALPLL